MKVRIDNDEWYPVYFIVPANESNEHWNEAILDIPQHTLDRFQEAFALFNQVQEELSALENRARTKRTGILRVR